MSKLILYEMLLEKLLMTAKNMYGIAITTYPETRCGRRMLKHHLVSTAYRIYCQSNQSFNRKICCSVSGKLSMNTFKQKH